MKKKDKLLIKKNNKKYIRKAKKIMRLSKGRIRLSCKAYINICEITIKELKYERRD